jgi:multiple sugar transport system substrate-binding protein
MTRMRTRIVAGTIAAATAAFALVGCSSSSSASSSIDQKNPTGTVQIWARSVMATWLDKVAKNFNASHKGLTVKITSINDSQITTKLSTVFRTSNVPDAIVIDPGQMINYMTSGNLMDITSQVKSSGLVPHLSKAQLGQATYQGKIYGTPAALDASVLVYNKDLFAKAGISGPPTTVAAMLTDAEKVRALGSNDYGITFAGDCAGCLAFTALPNFWNQGALIKGTNLDSQKANVAGNKGLEQVLQMYQQAWSKGLAPKSDQADNGTLWTKDFLNGNIGMVPASLGTYEGASAAQRKFMAIAPLPTTTGGISTYIGGANFGIAQKAKNPSGAWEFMQYALTKQSQELVPAGGFAPVRTDLLASDAFVKANPQVVPGLTASKTGFVLQTKYQDQLFNDAAGPWLAMFDKAVFQDDISGAMKAGQTGFQNVLSGNGS